MANVLMLMRNDMRINDAINIINVASNDANNA